MPIFIDWPVSFGAHDYGVSEDQITQTLVFSSHTRDWIRNEVNRIIEAINNIPARVIVIPVNATAEEMEAVIIQLADAGFGTRKNEDNTIDPQEGGCYGEG